MDAEVSGVLREGDVVRVFSKVGEPDGSGYWLDIRLPDSAVRGWVKDTDLDVYDTEPQAKTARESLLGNEVLPR